MKGWAIFYDDGAVLRGQTLREAEAAPGRGVVVIALRDVDRGDMVGPQILHGWDWYYLREDEGQWFGSDLTGLLDQLTDPLTGPHVCAVKQGRTVTSKRFREFCERAEAWLREQGA